MKTKILLHAILLLISISASAQLKFIIEDFEGMADGQTNIKKEGIFTYGSARATVDQHITLGYGYSGTRAMKIEWKKGELFGGWGKGVGLHIPIDTYHDYLNFYMYSPKTNGRSDNLKIVMEEDDNNNGSFEKDQDDTWSYSFKKENQDDWQLVSIPLTAFKDGNKGGDGQFNVGYKEGKLLTFIISFTDTNMIRDKETWYFDFLSFSKGALPVSMADKFEPKTLAQKDTCLLGTWSEEGKEGNFMGIASGFESLMNKNRKLDIVHFFMPFAAGIQKAKTMYPKPEKFNELISKGYTPMVTIEDHFVKVEKKEKQPNLYSIIEGHFDYHFTEWAKKIKEVKGTVLLRILHEFNGDWYPWCIANNDKNPELLIKAYHRIWNLFKDQNVTNVKFIWCPNSMSQPQAEWNDIMKAYPGDQYVDYVALDVYNGAGDPGIPIWRSFRKEAIENYFVLTEALPTKQLLICETSSRERKPGETGILQDKAGWIAQMSEALKTDLSKIKAVVWFNQYDHFKVNSSPLTHKSFITNFWMDPYYNKESYKNSLGKK